MKEARTIFIIGNDAMVAETLAMIFTARGFNAFSFTRPLQALGATRKTQPDVLIVDPNMEDLTGYEVAEEIKKVCPKCRVLLFDDPLSPSDLPESLYNAEILPRPSHPAHILQVVESLLNGGNLSAGRLP